jgi:CRP-like cAMP-binding protein/thioredoxin reductase/Fe-S-cluster-containing hydrogenase component 2
MDSGYELLIIGAGPAGLAAALNAQKSGLRYLLLEKEAHIADTAYGYQRGKLVMSEPSAIPVRGELWFAPAVRETVLQHWEETVRGSNVHVKLRQAVRAIKRSNGGFDVVAEREVFTATKVVVAIGSQGNPRKLGVAGEDLPHVLTRLTDPALYSDQDIVVVGGGDSAIEIAAALAARNRVTMAVRTPEFIRAKDALERRALELANRKELTIHFNATVESIDSTFVTLKLSSSTVKVRAGVVIVKIGALPPRQFLEDCGVRFTGPEPLGVPELGSGYETNVPGLFVIGAASGRGDLIKHGINQGYEVVEQICGRAVEPVDEAPLRERLALAEGTVAQRIQQLLPKAPLLAGASEAQIRELLFFSKFHRIAPGEIVFRQNDFSESLYMILDGTLEVLTRGDDGAERSVTKMATGEYFGEMSLMSGRRRSGTVRALKEALLWEVGRKAMLKFIHMMPQAKHLIDRTFVVRAFQIYVFPHADYAVLSNIAERAEVLTFERGAEIVREGDEGDSFFFLRSGKVKVYQTRNGREVIVAYLSAGQYFGEMALLTGEPRTASVRTIDRVEVIRVSRADFLSCIESSPALKKHFEEEAKRRHLRTLEMHVRPELAEVGGFMVREELIVGDNVLLIDENRCIQCDQCVSACESVHEDGQTRIKRTGMKFANILVANSCRHCENPLCMTDCPPGDAIARDPRGEVYIRDNCIGCGHCASNCPYDNIFMASSEKRPSAWGWLKAAFSRNDAPASITSETRSFPVKCDLCRDLKRGPACVRSCPTGAVLRLSPEAYHQKIETIALERKARL